MTRSRPPTNRRLVAQLSTKCPIPGHRFQSSGRANRKLFRARSLRVVSEARGGKAPVRARCVRALSIRRLEGCRPRFAADAGPMQIQWWEGAASSCAEAVPQSATRDGMSPEAGRMRKRILKSVVEELERRPVPRQSTEVRSGWKNTFELERVASCRSLDHRWRTKLDFSSGESFDDPHRPT